jgi:hypothetical protein
MSSSLHSISQSSGIERLFTTLSQSADTEFIAMATVRITGKVVKLMGYEFFGQLRTMTSSVV